MHQLTSLRNQYLEIQSEIEALKKETVANIQLAYDLRKELTHLASMRKEYRETLESQIIRANEDYLNATEYISELEYNLSTCACAIRDYYDRVLAGEVVLDWYIGIRSLESFNNTELYTSINLSPVELSILKEVGGDISEINQYRENGVLLVKVYIGDGYSEFISGEDLLDRLSPLFIQQYKDRLNKLDELAIFKVA